MLHERKGRQASRSRRGVMTKTHLIEKVAEKAKTLSRRDAEKVVNGIFDSIRDALKRGEKTEIRGFGSFRLRIRRTKDGRNPKTGETVSVPEKRMPFFKAGKEVKELLNEERPSHEQS
ncbi:MAG: integration host factor subunit beta [Nitrospira sp.]|nr:integration host factor subunit beta [Nitrospira sp.]MCY3956331.1 integration host factor subunit beta [Nitrospira sp.]MCY4132438.1 integration host factor subunit beta [Nitrospira sp.]